MGTKTRSMILIVLGVSLVVLGTNMRSAKISWEETVRTEKVIPGTKGRNALVGAGAGAALGGVLATVIGGIGIVACGTGIGMPAGVPLLATAAALGAGSGAIVGAATGKSATTAATIKNITHTAPAYETWQWASALVIGGVLLLLAILEIRKLKEATKQGKTEANKLMEIDLGPTALHQAPHHSVGLREDRFVVAGAYWALWILVPAYIVGIPILSLLLGYGHRRPMSLVKRVVFSSAGMLPDEIALKQRIGHVEACPKLQ